MLRRVRDWRFGVLSATLVVLLAQEVVTWRFFGDGVLAGGRATPAGTAATALAGVGMLLSLGAMLSLFYLYRLVVERQRVEEALRESEAKFGTAFRASPDALVFSTFPEGEILEVNDAFTTLTGYYPEEAIGRTTRELAFWAHLEDRERMLEMLRARGRVRDETWAFRHRQGQIRLSQVSVELIELAGEQALLSMIRDVTERTRAEEALRSSEEKFSKAFRASPDAILITTIPTGEILEVNDGFTRISGHRREDAVGRTTLELGIWGDLADRRRMLAILEEQGSVRDLAANVRGSAGELYSCLISAELVELAGRLCVLSVVRDVTERHQAEQEREQFIQELEAKNAELERFTYTVSHDLKSPLVTIRGFLGLLQKDVAAGDSERVQRDLERIEGATEIMRRLLDELLALSRVGRLVNPPEEVALDDLVRDAVELVAGRIAARGVQVDVAPAMPTVVGDRARLREVLQNLLDNAVKFLGDQPSPRIEVGATVRDAEVVCHVRDNGVGIEAPYQEKVFGLFERLDPEIDGTGIGLALAKRIVEVHGGRLWVESAGRGQGSTFFFSLPRVATARLAPPL